MNDADVVSRLHRGPPAASRFDAIDWQHVEAALTADGYCVLSQVLTARECSDVVALYERDEAFRSRIVMSRHNFGRGEYKYFDYPLPEIVRSLRVAAYPPLARIANRWSEQLDLGRVFPNDHEQFLRECWAAEQRRPTPLLLKYGAGDFNCLHQDVYGEHVFPLQIAILLSRPRHDFEGGELVLTEQRPRMQSRVEVVPLERGDAVVFPVRERPVQGTRGIYRTNMRHGVSRIRSGERFTLGIIFHDAM